MIEKVTEFLTDLLVKQNIISSEDVEIYQFGMIELLNVIFVTALLLIIGWLFGELWACVVFCSCFMGLRKYAGGYHSKTRGRCLLLTVVSIIIVLALLKFLELFWVCMLGFMLLHLIVILLLSPVDTANNRLDIIEKKYCRRKTKIILMIELLLFFIFTAIGYTNLSEAIWGAWAALSVSLIAESFIEIKIEKDSKKLFKQRYNRL